MCEESHDTGHLTKYIGQQASRSIVIVGVVVNTFVTDKGVIGQSAKYKKYLKSSCRIR